MPLFESHFMYFATTLGCSDCVNEEISIVPTKLIEDLVINSSEKKLRSVKLGRSTLVSPSPIFLSDFERFPSVLFG